MKPSDYKSEILNLASKGLKPTQIAKKLNLVPISVSQLLNRNGYFYTKNQGNTRYFKRIDTPEKAYFLGFIAADGYIVRSNKSSVTLGIQINRIDEYILQKLRKEIGCEKEITYPNSKMCRFTLSNKDLISDLENLGITQRKSLTLTNVLKNIPIKYRKYFVFGYFDGDGSVSFPKKGYTMCISFRGTKALLSGIVKELNPSNHQLFYDGKTWCLTILRHQDTINFYKIYKKSPINLSRKLVRLKSRTKLILSKSPKARTISSTLKR